LFSVFGEKKKNENIQDANTSSESKNMFHRSNTNKKDGNLDFATSPI